MDDTVSYSCPSCGESIEASVDPSAGPCQEYVEDCPVCCRPNLLSIRFDRDGRATASARPD
jgi:hypothetical protein